VTAVSPDRLLVALLAAAVVLLVVGWFGFRWGLDLEVARGLLVVGLMVVVLAGAGVLVLWAVGR